MMNQILNNIGKRGRQSLCSLICFSANTLLTLTFSLTMPAFLFSCSETEDTVCEKTCRDMALSLKAADSKDLDLPAIIDIFVFNDDGLQRLDSYQRITYSPENGSVPYSASRRGKKKIVAIVNPQNDKYEWAGINSFQSLLSVKAALEKEEGQKRLMSGTGYAYAGKDRNCAIEVSPMTSEIILNSIKCDFSSKPYRNAKLENVRVYLTNVNASASLLQTDNFKPEKLYNISGCSDEDLQEFSNPELICRSLENAVGSQPIFPGIKLLCYPNESSEDSPGSPFTRLVIEGRINGKICYYPISINRPESGHCSGEPGIGRNCRFVYDITIKSTGSSHPETEVTPGTMEIKCSTINWEDKDNNDIIF